jgi:hypothetical protein
MVHSCMSLISVFTDLHKYCILFSDYLEDQYIAHISLFFYIHL